MERKFTMPVSMVITQDQFDKDLEFQLNALGYRKGFNTQVSYGVNILVNNSKGRLGKISIVRKGVVNHFGRHFIDHYNPELFLALSAMSETSQLFCGEYVRIDKAIDLLKVLDSSDLDNVKVSSHADCFLKIPRSYLVKATAAEIIQHFTKKEPHTHEVKEYLSLSYGCGIEGLELKISYQDKYRIGDFIKFERTTPSTYKILHVNDEGFQHDRKSVLTIEPVNRTTPIKKEFEPFKDVKKPNKPFTDIGIGSFITTGIIESIDKDVYYDLNDPMAIKNTWIPSHNQLIEVCQKENFLNTIKGEFIGMWENKYVIRVPKEIPGVNEGFAAFKYARKTSKVIVSQEMALQCVAKEMGLKVDQVEIKG